MVGGRFALLIICWVKPLFEGFCDDTSSNGVPLLGLEIAVSTKSIIPNGSNGIANPLFNLLPEGFLILLNTIPYFLYFRDPNISLIWPSDSSAR